MYWLEQTLVVCNKHPVVLPGCHEVIWNGAENMAEDLGLEQQLPVGNNISWNAQTTYIMDCTHYLDIRPKLVADRVLKAVSTSGTKDGPVGAPDRCPLLTLALPGVAVMPPRYKQD